MNTTGMRTINAVEPMHAKIENQTVEIPPSRSQPPLNGPYDPQTTNAYAESQRDINRSMGLGGYVDLSV